MDIAAWSTSFSMAQTQQAVEITMLKKVMEMQETQAQALVENLQAVTVAAAPAPSFGHRLDMLI